ncbi:Uncharacterised protein [Achromobacter xylosoxidans]|nr:Uncharacterised protein [Achromobacter xylosoxidans]
MPTIGTPNWSSVSASFMSSTATRRGGRVIVVVPSLWVMLMGESNAGEACAAWGGWAGLSPHACRTTIAINARPAARQVLFQLISELRMD